MNAEDRTLAMLELHPWRPSVLAKTLMHFYGWNRFELGDHFQRLLRDDKMVFGWHGLYHRGER